MMFDFCISITTTATKNVQIIVLPSHSCGGTLQSLYAKLLCSSMQMLADGLNKQCQVSHCLLLHFYCNMHLSYKD